MRKSNISREEALALLEKYNKDPFHIRHALTVEGVMRYFARSLGYGDEGAAIVYSNKLTEEEKRKYGSTRDLQAPEAYQDENTEAAEEEIYGGDYENP